MDAPLSKGPEMRWQRKMNESVDSTCNDSTLNASSNLSMSGKTPMKVLNRSTLSNKTPAKTPRTPGSITKTPGKISVYSLKQSATVDTKTSGFLSITLLMYVSMLMYI